MAYDEFFDPRSGDDWMIFGCQHPEGNGACKLKGAGGELDVCPYSFCADGRPLRPPATD